MPRGADEAENDAEDSRRRQYEPTVQLDAQGSITEVPGWERMQQLAQEEARAGKEAAARTERMKQRTPRVGLRRVDMMKTRPKKKPSNPVRLLGF